MAMAAGAIGAVGSIVGGVMQASAMNQQAQQERMIAEWNADRYREKAAGLQYKAHQDYQTERKKGRYAASTHRAVVAQTGGRTDVSTPSLINAEIITTAHYNARLARTSAMQESAAMENKAGITLYEGEVRARAAEARANAALLNAFAGGIGGIAKGFGGGGGFSMFG